ncbi:MAG: glycoside hydrolase family 57 protein [bacterium]
MKPLRIAFLWHFHQPDYLSHDEYILPWTRLHGVKDYFDFPEVFYDHPKIKQNINLVPSLVKQIENYSKGIYFDKVFNLSFINPEDLTQNQKSDILINFFYCNKTNQIEKYARFKELYEKSKSSNAVFEYQDHDWVDLQVYYNLSWVGEFSKKNGICRRLLIKERNFSIVERNELMTYHIEIIKKIIYQYQTLSDLGQIELSLSPFYHPILPLLCNVKTASEALSDLDLSALEFSYPEDAKMQISKSIDYLRQFFPNKINGIWSSEGSLSNEVLGIMLEMGFSWTASDEKILSNSLHDLQSTDKYFPFKYINNGKEINIFFRDNKLSDKIGFEYSKWNENDAVNDFIYELNEIRNQLERNHGADSLDQAVVTVVLDGENCWEYYKNNGVNFLNLFYNRLSTPEFETVLFSDIKPAENSRILDSIKAGSWINGDFAIWISSKEAQIAWKLLADARNEFEQTKNELDKQTYDEIYENLLIAEGSDWFWWYHSTHHSELEPEFDLLFRNRLQTVYKLLNIKIPEELLQPIGNYTKDSQALNNVNNQELATETNENNSMHKTGNY